LQTSSPVAAKKKAELNGGDSQVAVATSAPSAARDARPLDQESVQAIWCEALSNLTDLLGDNAARAESVTLAGDNRLVATFRAKYTSCKTFCEREAQRQSLESALADAAGQPIRVEFRVIEDEPAAEAPRPVAPLRQQMAAVSEHPLVARANELFGARLVRVDRDND
jgi:hypothetical protein